MDGGLGEQLLLVYGPLGLGVFALAVVVRHLYQRMNTNTQAMIDAMQVELNDLRSQRNGMIKTLLELVPLMERSNRVHEMRQVADEATKQTLADTQRLLSETRTTLGDVRDVLRDVRRLGL